MARGWESKAVEAQQAEASRRKPLAPPIPEDEAVRRAQRATLMLARSRAQADLENATAAAHRSMLRHAIADLDRQIDGLS